MIHTYSPDANKFFDARAASPSVPRLCAVYATHPPCIWFRGKRKQSQTAWLMVSAGNRHPAEVKGLAVVIHPACRSPFGCCKPVVREVDGAPSPHPYPDCDCGHRASRDRICHALRPERLVKRYYRRTCSSTSKYLNQTK